MSKLIQWLGGSLVALSLVAFVGCDKGPGVKTPPPADDHDHDGDGKDDHSADDHDHAHDNDKDKKPDDVTGPAIPPAISPDPSETPVPVESPIPPVVTPPPGEGK
ncbi:MAG: hypothetical protein SGJ20_17530 [Planctomycetota bacterium]|nr:hypothetical protein [Planctomycetota bacterium]